MLKCNFSFDLYGFSLKIFLYIFFYLFFSLSLSFSATNKVNKSLITISSKKECVFNVELATSKAQHEKGLMGRVHLKENQGMFFIYNQEKKIFFWMKDTPTSLDILFIDHDYIIKNIVENTIPFSEKLIPSKYPIKYVLEIKAGSVKRCFIEIGDKVNRL